MALSAAYFVGDLFIPNIAGSSITETSNLFSLQVAMAKYEPIYLRWLLGEELYEDYVAGISATTPEPRWTALRDKIYVENSVLGIGFSPAANYVYFFFQRNNATLTLVNGEGRANHENMTAVSPAEKMIAAWNDMVRMSLDIQDWLQYDVPEDYGADFDTLGIFETINSLGI